MKQYFAKYLPVEGGIKEGDIILDIFSQYSKAHKSNLQSRNPPKVKYKLFLCSRDIQVGDKVLDEEFCDWIVQENDLKALHLLTKVIGEISPDARWVKEGDEFDADTEVMPILDRRIINFDSQMDWTEAEYEHYIKFYKLKGPCGHFH